MSLRQIIMISATLLSLTACTGSEERIAANTYGLSEQQWALLSKSERYAIKESHREQQILAEQRRLNAELVRARNENTRLSKN